MCLEAQGHGPTLNIFEEDNVSVIRLEANGRALAGTVKTYRHLTFL
jgi:hypothetical protein